MCVGVIGTHAIFLCVLFGGQDDPGQKGKGLAADFCLFGTVFRDKYA